MERQPREHSPNPAPNGFETMRTPINLGHKSRYAHSVEETGQLEQREQLAALLGGVAHENFSRVGRIGNELAHLIGVRTDLVLVTTVTALKVKGKHTTQHDLGLLPHGFARGRVQQDRPRHLTFLFRDPRDAMRTLKAVVKATRHNEVLLSTYHVCTGGQLRRALKKGVVIRDDGTWLSME
jgi:hypothetical protein